MKYALDTNTVTYFFKGQGEVARHLLAKPPALIAVPALVVYEIEFGLSRSTAPARRQEQLAAFLDTVTVLPFGRDEAREAARIRRDLERAGRPIGPLDVLIAATAAAASCTLVTHNVREFARIRGLKTEDWF